MWVSIVGATGTGKHEIKDLLVREDFEYLEIKEPAEPHVDLFERQFQFFMQRVSVHLQAQEVMNKQDVVTIGSVWDSIDVHYWNLVKNKLVPTDKIALHDYADTVLLPRLKSPHSVIYCFTEPMTAFNRMQLRGGMKVTPAEYNVQIALYKEFVNKIKVPLIEVDFGQPMDRILRDFEFNLASLRTTAVTAQSLWDRSFLK